MPQPLGEIFGYPITNRSAEADDARKRKRCPFKGPDRPCYKSSKTAPIGVCSVFSAGKPAIICPIRFLEGYQITKDAADFFFPPRTKYKILPEVRVEIDVGTANRVRVGNIDLVIAAHDDSGRLIDWGGLEIQSVYTSGSIGKVFKEHQGQGYPAQFSWPTNETPHPDWLSSTRKRLAPQLLFKGTLLKKWGKKQAVAVQESFYNTLPPLDVPDVAVPRDQADLAWLIYDLGAWDANIDNLLSICPVRATGSGRSP